MTIKQMADNIYRSNNGRKSDMLFDIKGTAYEDELMDELDLRDWVAENGMLELNAPNDNELRRRVSKRIEEYFPELSREEALREHYESIWSDVAEGNSDVYARLAYLDERGLL